MSHAASPRYDIVIVGAGPVGSYCALVHAQKGARVALLEANPKAATRLAGEWLHPPAVRMLRDVGVRFDPPLRSTEGQGFVVFPEDGSEPIVLPYPDGARGMACDHETLVTRLHEAVGNEPDIDYLVNARVIEVEDDGIVFTRGGSREHFGAARVVGADGRASVVRRSLGLPMQRRACSRMVGVILEGVSLQPSGYGNVILGGPGPVLGYPLGEHCARIVVDVPLEHWATRDRIGLLAESYARVLPEALRPAYISALQAGKFHAAANELRPRVSYGTSSRVLISDAAGHYHPMTAVGMTLGFGDAAALAEGRDFRDFAAGRFAATRAPELLALGLYEVFADHRLEAVALRRAIYRNWRTHPVVRDRTMRLLACEDTSTVNLGLALLATAARAVAGAVRASFSQLAWRRARDVIYPLVNRIRWLFRGIRKLQQARNEGGGEDRQVRRILSRAFLVSMSADNGAPRTGRRAESESADTETAMRKAAARLLGLQSRDGAWEGEMVWCPMLTAQYVLLQHILAQPIEPGRRRRLLRSFECTRLEHGAWGLHEHSPPHLFVTSLVYVASRLLGVERNNPLIEPAGRFLRANDVLAIPSWGKFWLALLNLYDWRGVNAILPELWMLPRGLPLHPSNWYCHTRLIYMAMASIYPHRYQAPVTPVIQSLREELFGQEFARVDFPSGRNRLRDDDLFARPSIWLRAAYALARSFERCHSKRLRARCRRELIRRIQWELQTTSHTSISPVSGFLNVLALWLHDPEDADLRAALGRLDSWFWEDEELGARVTGARSSTWDTAFSVQALAAVPGFDAKEIALRKGADFLRRQQIRCRAEGFRNAYRADPKGGWCFPGGWHGWPVSDCTAEAVLGILAVGSEAADEAAIGEAVGFMLRSQNRNGGFGSYEARRSRIGLEWLNPAEMFGESMTEHSYVECTASCLEALASCGRRFPEVLNPEAKHAISRGAEWLRKTQARDGSWRGVWGVQFIYGTFFGVRGLLAAGARPSDPAVRLACRWLLDRQREDGGWGEHHSGCLTGRYVAHEESQVIQTAWALIALLEASDSNWTAIVRGVRFLLDIQDADGGWPKQDMAGVFFRTALLDYVLYRQYFPLRALGLYEQRRQARLDLTAASK